MRQLQLEQAKQVTKLRQEVEQGARDLASKADRRMKVRSCVLHCVGCRLKAPPSISTATSMVQG